MPVHISRCHLVCLYRRVASCVCIPTPPVSPATQILEGGTMKYLVLLSILFGVNLADAATEVRCGWYANPTPANTWLTDRDGSWIIDVQGGHQAKGVRPEFDTDDKTMWVHTNVASYGYGCACLKVTVNRAKMRVEKVHGARAKPLRMCDADAGLKRP